MLVGLVWNVILAFAWFFLSGNFSMASFIVGLIFGYFCLFLAQSQIPSIQGYAGRIAAIISFIIFFFSELVKSNIAVAKAVINPAATMEPGVVAVPLSTDNNAAITLMANFITITPGTISMDVSGDKSTIYIHALDCSDPQDIIDGTKDLEARVLRLFG